MGELTKLERSVLDKLLAGDEPALSVLREQLLRARVSKREKSGRGFFVEFEVDDDALRIQTMRPRVHFGDVEAKVEGLEYGAGFVLFVSDGQLEMLEGYTYGEDWPRSAGDFELRYSRPERDLSSLMLSD